MNSNKLEKSNHLLWSVLLKARDVEVRDSKCSDSRLEIFRFEARDIQIRGSRYSGSRLEIFRFEARDIQVRDSKYSDSRLEIFRFEARNVQVRGSRYSGSRLSSLKEIEKTKPWSEAENREPKSWAYWTLITIDISLEFFSSRSRNIVTKQNKKCNFSIMNDIKE